MRTKGCAGANNYLGFISLMTTYLSIIWGGVEIGLNCSDDDEFRNFSWLFSFSLSRISFNCDVVNKLLRSTITIPIMPWSAWKQRNEPKLFSHFCTLLCDIVGSQVEWAINKIFSPTIGMEVILGWQIMEECEMKFHPENRERQSFFFLLNKSSIQSTFTHTHTTIVVGFAIYLLNYSRRFTLLIASETYFFLR